MENDEAGGVFVEQQPANVRAEKKTRAIGRKQLDQLADDFAAAGRRENEGEAAMYGITFDDSQYDYMQHLKPIGQHQDAYFIGKDGKISDSYLPPEHKDKMTLGDLLNGGPGESLPEPTWKEHYQSQLPIQDSIAGLKPDMDPRLREVLEALEDEEYVDEDVEGEEDLFSQLICTGEVKDESEWKQLAPEEQPEELVQRDGEEDWEFAFRKFQISSKKRPSVASDDVGSSMGGDVSDFGDVSDVGSNFEGSIAQSEARDTFGELPKVKSRRKKKIGAKTDLSGYSMSSSANYRNEGLTLLDDSFDKVEEEYVQPSDSEEEEAEFDMTKERPDLENIMDEFLDGYVVEGKHLYKKTK